MVGWENGLRSCKYFNINTNCQHLPGRALLIEEVYLPIMQLCRRIRQVVPGMLHVQKVVNQLMNQRVEVKDNTIPTGKGLGKPGRGKSYSKR